MSEREKHTLLTSRGVVADLFDAQPRRGGRHGSEGFLVLRVSLNALREALKQASADTQADELVRALDAADAVSNELLIAPVPTVREDRERMDELITSLMPAEIPQPVELLQARRSAQMRRDMLSRFGYFTAEELADMHGSKARNRYALAARWMREGRIFGVPLGARSVFPAFQFDSDGHAYPIVATVLDALPREDMSPWSVGLWWFANNAFLPGEARPAELIGTKDQERLLDAAQRLAQPLPL